MENPSHMTPLSQCWRLDRPPPDEAKGKKRAELVKTQLHKFDAIVKEHKVITNHNTNYDLNAFPLIAASEGETKVVFRSRNDKDTAEHCGYVCSIRSQCIAEVRLVFMFA